MPRDRRVGARNLTSRHCWAISVLKSERVVRYRTHLRSFLSPSLYPLLESSPSLLVRRERKDSRSMPDRPLCSDRGPGDKEQGCYHRGAGRSRYACFYIPQFVSIWVPVSKTAFYCVLGDPHSSKKRIAFHCFPFSFPLVRFSLFYPFYRFIHFYMPRASLLVSNTQGPFHCIKALSEPQAC